MNLLILDQFSDVGGAQQGILDLLPAIRSQGWRALVGLPGDGPLFDRVREMGFDAEPIVCGPYTSGSKSLADAGRFLVGTPRLARQVHKLADRMGAHLIYVNGPRLLPGASLAALRAPVVFHAHSFLFPGTVRQLAGRALRQMKASVIASCHFVGDPWLPYAGAGRVKVIYNGVKAGGIAGARLPGAPLAVGCVGRIAPEKGQLEFIQVARMIRRVLPGCRFGIFGAALFSEPASSRYAEEVRAAASQVDVALHGWAPDPYAVLEKLDLLLVPSAGHEATTRVILEAFAVGVPVIAFRSGGIPEVVHDGVNGFLVRSADEMAERSVELLSGDPARAAEISRAARESWSHQFTLEGYRAHLVTALRHAAGRGETRAGLAAPHSMLR